MKLGRSEFADYLIFFIVLVLGISFIPDAKGLPRVLLIIVCVLYGSIHIVKFFYDLYLSQYNKKVERSRLTEKDTRC